MNLNPNPNPAFKDPTITTASSPDRKSDSKPNFNIDLSFQNTLVPSLPNTNLPPATAETTETIKTTTYHIYPTPQNPCHALITQHNLPKSSSARRKLLKHNPDLLTSDSSSQSPSESYFLHLPTLTFHSPPRTLRRGATKTSPPICIFHNSPFWKRWRILTGTELLDAIDPRGLLPYERRSAANNRPRAEGEVKGYRVRSWRACGESGKEYLRKVHEERKRRRNMVSGGGDGGDDRERRVWDPVRAEEVLPVTWMHATPFSTRVRWYGFMYEGVKGTWKGSHDIPERKKWARRLMPVHHLKLVVEGDGGGGDDSVSKNGEKHDHDHGQNQEQDQECGFEKRESDEEKEIVLARYSSSLSHGKHGTLVIFDDEVRKVFGSQDLVRSRQDFACNREKEVGVVDEYDVIVATAMCMILGEWQKRKTVLEILLALAGAGADGGSAMA